MNKELEMIYAYATNEMNSALKHLNKEKVDWCQNLLCRIEDADKFYSCLECKHFDDGCMLFAQGPTLKSVCSRYVEDLWESYDEE